MNCVPLKQWCAEEAQRCDVTPSAIYLRLMRGKYPNVQLIHRNQRVVFVEKDKEFDWFGVGAFTEGIK